MRRAFPAEPFDGETDSGSGRENAVETRHVFVRPANICFPYGRGTGPAGPPGD